MEVDNAVDKCIERIILANAHVLTGIVLGATLAYNNVTGSHSLTTPDFHTESL